MQAELEPCWRGGHHLLWSALAGLWREQLQPPGLCCCHDCQHAVRPAMDNHTGPAARHSRIQWPWSLWRPCGGSPAAHSRSLSCLLHLHWLADSLLVSTVTLAYCSHTGLLQSHWLTTVTLVTLAHHSHTVLQQSYRLTTLTPANCSCAGVLIKLTGCNHTADYSITGLLQSRSLGTNHRCILQQCTRGTFVLVLAQSASTDSAWHQSLTQKAMLRIYQLQPSVGSFDCE